MHKYLLRLVPAAFLVLGACTENLEELRDATPVGSPYTKTLFAAYKEQANLEADEMDFRIAEFLAEKGLRAAGGEEIYADDIGEWDVPPEHVQELAEGRQLLREAYRDGLHTTYPEHVAKAQVSFDTWLAGLYFGDDEAARRAREGMMSALADLAVKVMRPNIESVNDKSSSMSKLTQEQAIDEYNHVGHGTAAEEGFVFFANGSSEVNGNDMRVVRHLADTIIKGGFDKVSVFGYTSSSGSEAANLRISQKRAEAVKEALIEALGQAGSGIEVTAAGQGATAPSNIPAKYQRAAVIKII